MTHRSLRIGAAVFGAALLLGACGAGTAADSTSETTAIPAPTTLPAPTTTQPSPPTTTEPSTTSTTMPPSTTIPGETVDLGPAEGDVLGVVGVAHDDALNVRSGPGTDFEVVAELEPTENDVVAMGVTRMLDQGFWTEVQVAGVTGWVNLSYVAYYGSTDDITARVVELLGETPEVETMLDMGTLVAQAVADADGGEGVDIVMSVAPSVGDLGEVTFDVTGFGDDSVLGSRLHVFGTPSESGEGFILKSVEATTFCSRGVTEGVCS